MTLVNALLAALAVSAVSLIGLLTFFNGKDLHKRVSHLLLSMAAGAMLGNAILHLLPSALALEANWLGGAEILEHAHEHGAHEHNGLLVAAFILVGVVVFHLIDLALRRKSESNTGSVGSEGWLVFGSDAIENFLDGIVIGTAFLVSNSVGIAATITILLHEVPLELGDYVIMRHAGFARWKALGLNFASGLISLLGVFVAVGVGTTLPVFTLIATPVAVGALIYIALCVILPHVRRVSEGSKFQYVGAMLVGISLMALILLLE